MKLLRLITFCGGNLSCGVLVQNCLQGDGILLLLFNVAFEYLIRKAKEYQGRLEQDVRLVSVLGQNMRSLKIRTSNIGH
jgi:hypothetical protein